MHLKLFVQKHRILLLCWLVVTLVNINKAFHIDDTFHLEAATYIIEHLLSPMSGNINWSDYPTPMHQHNQPPLFFLLIGICIKFFNSNEITLHFLLSLFSFLALFYFQKILELIQIRKTGIYIILLAFNPAFIVNQNLMTDIPILSCTLIFFYFLIKTILFRNNKILIYSMIALSAGLLIKYSLLPELMIALIGLILSKKFKQLSFLLIPLGTLTLWSIWNYYEFGDIHVFSRPKKLYNNDQLFAFIGTLGAISSFSILIIPAFTKKYLSNTLITILVLSISICVYFLNVNKLSIEKIQHYLHSLFMVNGACLILFIVFKFFKFFKKEKVQTLKIIHVLTITQVIGISLFIIVYAPFMATRHLLLILPFILLFFKDEVEKTTVYFKTIFLCTSILFGLLLGISDYSYADFYRKKAGEIMINKHVTTWTVGHWGWQWYAKKAGMKFYSQEEDWKLKNGDYLIIPKNISKQKLNENLKIDTLKFITEKPLLTTFFSGNDFATMYNSFYHKPAWTISKNTIDTIFICKIIKGVPYRKKLPQVERIILEIKNDANWFSAVKTKAKNQKIPIDSMLVLDAMWVLNH